MATLDAITLPDDLVWEDEFDYTPQTQTLHKTLTGDIVVETATENAARPMTLGGGQGGEVWVTKAVADALLAKVFAVPAVMALSWRGASYSVIFRHENAPPVEARQVDECYDPAAGDFYSLRLKLWII